MKHFCVLRDEPKVQFDIPIVFWEDVRLMGEEDWRTRQLTDELTGSGERECLCVLIVCVRESRKRGVYTYSEDSESEKEQVKERERNQTLMDKYNDPHQTGGGKFSRYWIYSHHIYSKIKRRNILDMAREYDVTGMCVAKPSK